MIELVLGLVVVLISADVFSSIEKSESDKIEMFYPTPVTLLNSTLGIGCYIICANLFNQAFYLAVG